MMMITGDLPEQGRLSYIELGANEPSEILGGEAEIGLIFDKLGGKILIWTGSNGNRPILNL